MKKKSPKTSPERRKFLGQASAATAAVLAAGAIGLEPLLGGKESVAEAAAANGNGNSNAANRANNSFNYRKNMAQDQKVNVGPQADNGDAARFTDFSCSYSKALKHDNLGIPNSAAMLSMKNALASGSQADFANIIVGTPVGGDGNSKLNGPQVALAFDLEGLDSHATVIPPAPSVSSAQTAAEQVEHYWAALLRDVAFTDYANPANPMYSLVGQAVADMNNMSYISAANNQFPHPVTRQNLFRGQFVLGDGNVKGPYISQFMIQPTFFGSQPLDQKYRTFVPGQEFMTSPSTYQQVQNGGPSGSSLIDDFTYRYLRNGRDLAAYTRVDVLYQGYFTAFLVLAGLGAAPNPGNPYNGSQTQKAFATLGGPDAAGTIAEMATRALKAAWFHKWIKDLRMRPEEYGALVHAQMTNAHPMPQAAAALHSDVLNSAALPLIYANSNNYGPPSYLLPQAFPEGSPTHPCYPTGHGTVGGACVTALKFFFKGSQKIRPLLTAAVRDVYEPSTDGLSLNPYTGADAGDLDINGELNKLAYNVSFGHGIHAGIHFRSSTYWSILLGEQVALSVLQDRAKSYNEPFTISIKKFDGTTATITNQ
jgi:hypothetical protein